MDGVADGRCMLRLADEKGRKNDALAQTPESSMEEVHAR